MDPYKERNFHKNKDRSFKITPVLAKIWFFDILFLYVAKLLIKILKSISRKGKNNTGRLVIICLHRLGDTVFCIPAIDGIYKCYNDFKVTIISYPETKRILEIKYNRDNIVTLDKTEFIFQRRFAKKSNRKVVKELNPEIIFDLTGNPASASLLLNTGARQIIGTNLPYFENLYSIFVPIRKVPHYMDIYLDVLRKVKPEFNGYTYEFEKMFNKKDKIVVHPFAIRKAKEWSLRKFIKLAYRLNTKYEVSIISPPDFIEEDIVDELNSLGLEFQITNTINELIDKIKTASVFISNDSGPIYIANLLGKPTFTIYGPTNPKFSLPFGKYHKYYQKKLSCTAKEEKVCFTLGGINCPSQECIHQITIEEIENSVTDFLSGLGILSKDEIQNQ